MASIYSTTATFPQHEQFGLISQLRRAAVSVPANIAEGFARNGSKEKNCCISSALRVAHYRNWIHW
nr:four helix bundle protein [Methylobacillus flagellatus]